MSNSDCELVYAGFFAKILYTSSLSPQVHAIHFQMRLLSISEVWDSLHIVILVNQPFHVLRLLFVYSINVPIKQALKGHLYDFSPLDKGATIAPILRFFYPTFTRSCHTINTLLAIFTILFLPYWLLFHGWFYYYVEYYRLALNLLSRVFFPEIEQNLDSGSLLWQFFFSFHYVIYWITWPVLIMIQGVDSLYKITWIVVPHFMRVVWPEILVMLNEILPTAANDLFNMLILPDIIVTIPALLPSLWN